MPTAKKRINLSINEHTHKALSALAKKRNQPLAGLSMDLIEQALEFQEDLYFSNISDDRLSKKQKRLTHDEIWD